MKSATMEILSGILGAFAMAVGGAILFYFLFTLDTTHFQNFLPSAEQLVAILGFISFLFLGLGLLLIVQSGRRD